MHNREPGVDEVWGLRDGGPFPEEALIVAAVSIREEGGQKLPGKERWVRRGREEGGQKLPGKEGGKG